MCDREVRCEVPGSTQYLVWNTPGTKTVTVVASHGRLAPLEKTSAQVVITPASQTVFPKLKIRWMPDAPAKALLKVLDAPEPGLIARPRRASTNPKVAGAAGRKNRSTPNQRANVRSRQGSCGAWRGDGCGRWCQGLPALLLTFSTGRALQSAAPRVSHDFGPHLDPKRLYSVFHIAVQVPSPSGAAKVIERSVSVMNPYFLMKSRRVLQPPMVAADASVKFAAGSWRFAFTLHNPEDAVMNLTSRRVERFFDQGSQRSELLAGETVAIALAPNADTVVDVALSRDKIPTDVSSIAVHFTGEGPGKLPVRVGVHIDVPPHASAELVLSAAAEKVLADLIVKGHVSDAKSISGAELTALGSRGLLKQVDLAALRPVARRHFHDQHQSPPNAVEGQTCEPWNLPEVIPPDLACLPTKTTQHKKMPARLMNAMKGHIILSPRNGSLISLVFRL